MATDPLTPSTRTGTGASHVPTARAARSGVTPVIARRGTTAAKVQRRGTPDLLDASPASYVPEAAAAPPIIQRKSIPTLRAVSNAAVSAVALAKQLSIQKTVRRIAIWGVVGSLAVHLILGALSAVVIGQRTVILIVDAAEEPEPEVQLVFPEAARPEERPREPERYVRTAQNQAEDAPPEKSDFISDKNTVAFAKEAPDADGDPALPSMKGTDDPGLELAETKSQDGEIREDSAPTPPPSMAAAAPPPSPAAEQPPPAPDPPKQEMAKKEDTSIERILQELESATAFLEPPSAPPPAPPAMAQNDPPAPAPAAAMAEAAAETPPALQEAYMPETRMRTVKGAIAQRGDQNSVNAAKTLAGNYYREVHDAIGQRWNKEVKIKNVELLPGRLVLRFLIGRDGSVRQKDIVIAVDEGGPVLKQTAYNAVFNTKLPPIPDEMAPVLVNDRFEMVINFITH